MAGDEHPTAGLRRRFIGALSAIALLSVTAYALLSASMRTQESDAPTINVAGRQRMLSQRIAEAALQLSVDPQPAARERLETAIADMDRAHTALTHGDPSLGIPPERSPELDALYFDTEPALDPMVRRFLGHARRVSEADRLAQGDPDLRALSAMAAGPLLRRLDDAVKQYAYESAAALDRVRDIEFAIMLTTLALLTLEGLVLFRPMAQRLAAQFEHLAEQTAQLEDANDAMQRVLDNAGDAMVSVHVDGRLRPERSAALEAWFGPVTEGVRVWEYLYGTGESSDAVFMEQGFELLASGLLPPDVAVEQMPAGLVREGSQFEIHYRPVDDHAGGVATVLVVLIDVTAKVRHEQAEQRIREIHAVVRRMTADQGGFGLFVEEASIIVESLPGLLEDRPRLLRSLHTLKGNVGVYGLERLAAIVHRAESDLGSDDDPALCRRTLDAVADEWADTMTQLASFLERDQGAPTIELLESEYGDHVRLLHSRAEFHPLLPIVTRWAHQRVEGPCNDLGALASSIAERQDKRLQVSVSGGHHRLSRERFHEVWRALVHVVRNAVDHGIERPTERAGLGKSPEGHLEIAVDVDEDMVRISIEDDGRGIDWDRLALQAAEAGLPFGTEAERTAALFAAGISSRDEVTDLSGRGVGTTAVLEAVRALGGSVLVLSEPGRGSRFEFVIPDASVAALAA